MKSKTSACVFAAVSVVSLNALAWPSIPDPVSAAREAASGSSQPSQPSQPGPAAPSSPNEDYCVNRGEVTWAREFSAAPPPKNLANQDQDARSHCDAGSVPRGCAASSYSVMAAACEKAALESESGEEDGRYREPGTDEILQGISKMSATISARASAEVKKRRDDAARARGAVDAITENCATLAAAKATAQSLPPQARARFDAALKAKLDGSSGSVRGSYSSQSEQLVAAFESALNIAKTHVASKGELPGEVVALQEKKPSVICYDEPIATKFAALKPQLAAATAAALTADAACTANKKCTAERSHHEQIEHVCTASSAKQAAAQELAAEKRNMKATGVTRPFVLGKLAGDVKDTAQSFAELSAAYLSATGRAYSDKLCP